jgi:hypothetical protein
MRQNALFPAFMSPQKSLVVGFSVLLLAACGQKDCSLPDSIENPTGQEISLEEFVDGQAGEYRAVKVEYFFQKLEIATQSDSLYRTYTTSKVSWPENSEAQATFDVQCHEGHPDSSAKVSSFIPYSVDRANGKTAQARDEKLSIKGSTLKSHSSKKLEALSFNDFVNNMEFDFLHRIQVKIYKQSPKRFVVVTQGDKSFELLTVQTAITYELQ